MSDGTAGIVDGTAPPYYAAILTTVSSEHAPDLVGYDEASARMLEIAQGMDGFLGLEFARTNAAGIAVSYWRDLSCLRAWRHDAEHLGVQLLGQQRFYRAYRARICLVEREYEWHRGDPTGQTPDIPRWDAAR